MCKVLRSLGGDDAEADVDAAVGAAAGDVRRGLAVDQHAVLQDEVSAKVRCV